jgi:hypothetical protein
VLWNLEAAVGEGVVDRVSLDRFGEVEVAERDRLGAVAVLVGVALVGPPGDRVGLEDAPFDVRFLLEPK